MIILVFILSIVAIISGILVFHSEKKASVFRSTTTQREDIGIGLTTAGAIVGIITLIAIIVLAVGVSEVSIIDDKIAMYQEENTKIEEQVATAVQGFQDHESKVFEEASAESAITLVSLYPELKSDTLVQSQIEIYVENNEKIKELKEQKIDGDVYRWWLYFGGNE